MALKITISLKKISRCQHQAVKYVRIKKIVNKQYVVIVTLCENLFSASVFLFSLVSLCFKVSFFNLKITIMGSYTLVLKCCQIQSLSKNARHWGPEYYYMVTRLVYFTLSILQNFYHIS